MDLRHRYAFHVMLVIAAALMLATALAFVSFHSGGHDVGPAQLLHQVAARHTDR